MRSPNPKFLNKEWKNCLSKARKTRRECLIDDCAETAIRSHIAWKEGWLRPLATDGDIYMQPVHRAKYNGENSSFEPVGIREAFTFKGYCKKHDGPYFQPIETGEIDFNNTEHLRLLFERGLQYEKRKISELISTFQCMGRKRLIENDNVTSIVEGQSLGKVDIDRYLSLLSLPESISFQFITRVISGADIVSVAMFDRQSLSEQEQEWDSIGLDVWKNKLLDSVLFAAIPREDENTDLVFGFLSEYATENAETIEWIEGADDTLLKRIVSEILTRHVETWACSFEFYNKAIKYIEEEIISNFQSEEPTFEYNMNLAESFWR